MKKDSGNYSKCWDFFMSIRWYFVFALGIFLLSFLIGFALPIFFEEEILKFIEELSKKIEGKGTFEIIWFIFLNNLKASFLAMILGIGFGIFPLITSVINGYLLGFVSRGAAEVAGIGSIWRLFPHGIFELPAILLSLGIGFKLGMDLFSKDPKKKLKKDLKEALRFFVFVVIPLLTIAGIIEGVLVGVLSRA